MNLEQKNDEIVNRVKNKLQSRSVVGIEKYGTTIWDNADENYVKHFQEECLDAANYCEMILRLGEFNKKVIELLETHPNDATLGFYLRSEYNKFKQEENK